MHQKNALVAAPISLARSMREQREIAWAMSTIRCKSFCQSVKGGAEPGMGLQATKGTASTNDALALTLLKDSQSFL